MKKVLNGNSHLLGWIALMITILSIFFTGAKWFGTIEQEIKGLTSQTNRIEQKIDQHLANSQTIR